MYLTKLIKLIWSCIHSFEHLTPGLKGCFFSPSKNESWNIYYKTTLIFISSHSCLRKYLIWKICDSSQINLAEIHDWWICRAAACNFTKGGLQHWPFAKKIIQDLWSSYLPEGIRMADNKMSLGFLMGVIFKCFVFIQFDPPYSVKFIGIWIFVTVTASKFSCI